MHATSNTQNVLTESNSVDSQTDTFDYRFLGFFGR